MINVLLIINLVKFVLYMHYRPETCGQNSQSVFSVNIFDHVFQPIFVIEHFQIHDKKRDQ